MADYLPYMRIVAINDDLLHYVVSAKTTEITGKDLAYIYEERNGVYNHGFEDDKYYRIFTKEGKYALVA